MLDRISRLAASRRAAWVAVGVWLALGIALGPLQPRLQEATTNEPEEFLPESAGSTRAIELLRERFPSGRTLPAILVFRREGGLTQEDRQGIARALEAVARVERAGRPLAPFGPGGEPRRAARRRGLIAPDGDVAGAIVPIRSGASEQVRETVERIRELIGAGADQPAGTLQTHVTGAAGLLADATDVFQAIDLTLLAVTATLVLVLLLAIYRSPVIALVPLLVVATAYAIAAAAVLGLIEAGAFEVNGQSTGFLIVLMFGAGTDYALLVVARYREELRRRADHREAMVLATRRTSPAILSAGGTVFAAVLVLLLADLRSTASLGPVLAIGIAVMVAAGLTLLPALLVSLRRGAFWPSVPRVGEEQSAPLDVWRRISAMVRRWPIATATAVAVTLAVGAVGNVVPSEELGFLEGFRNETDATAGQRVLERELAAGEGATVTVVAERSAAGEALRAVRGLQGVVSVRRVERSRDERLVHLSVTPAAEPLSERAERLVRELRRRLDRVLPEGATAAVGGPTAQSVDTAETLASDARLIIPAVLGLIAVILAVLLRALIAPLYLVATVVLSFGFALGVSELVFTQLLGMEAISPSLPTFAFIFLVALGVDYNIFLMARAREEAGRLPIERAVPRALETTGGVITSAGLILAGTFGALMLLPLESLFQFGFTIAFGLLVDTFVVRTLLVPSVALAVGERSWWPGRLGRRAPPRGAS